MHYCTPFKNFITLQDRKKIQSSITLSEKYDLQLSTTDRSTISRLNAACSEASLPQDQ